MTSPERWTLTSMRREISAVSEAVERGPVVLTRRDRDVAVLLSVDDYRYYLQLAEIRDELRAAGRAFLADAAGLHPRDAALVLEFLSADPQLAVDEGDVVGAPAADPDQP